MQAWPSLARGPLGHLWEAGLDPLDPLFLENINEPTAFWVRSPEKCLRLLAQAGLDMRRVPGLCLLQQSLRGTIAATCCQSWRLAQGSVSAALHRSQNIDAHRIRLMQAKEEYQSEIDLLLHPMSSYSSDERYPSSF